MTAPLLKVDDLHITLQGDGTTYNAVENVSFEIGRGEAFGLVGESGCGKSITALAVMGLLRRPLGVGKGRIVLDGEEIQNASAARLRELRGPKIGMIFQEPMTALNPLSPVGRQIAEMFVLHQSASWREAMDRAEDALRQVRVPSPERRIKDFPHQLSGGMRQRVMIAIALACRPDLLIADEPTTALDVTVQAEIIDLMAELCAAKGTAILMISHDLGLVANMCRRVAVMYAGRIVESQGAEAIFATPRHPYTKGLVDSLPRLGERSKRGRQRLREISGVVPSIAAYPAGCRFNPRCPSVTDICRSAAPDVTALGDGLVRCHHHE
ncbi:MAG: ABC transporter ATP-binding protein [Reyranella sp.]|nr:ABC transporter ATP-binding protein [Reyranella sp.]